MTARLFQPFSLRDVELANRVVVAPMCQYSAVDGQARPWHVQHYGSLAVSGPALVVIEAAGVRPEGRISDSCLGLWDDRTEAALGDLVRTIKSFGTSRIGLQLSHAGRKAGFQKPWISTEPVNPHWRVWAPSAIPFDENSVVPEALDADEIRRVKEAFVAAVVRAHRIGVDVIELHSAHGYLLHQFLSPLANRRTDAYGGSLENRLRFPLEVVEAARAALPSGAPLGVRISATEWTEGGFSIDDSVIYANALREIGVDFICVSSGGGVAAARVPIGPGYQLGLSRRIRREAAIATRAVGLLVTPDQAEDALQAGDADLIAQGRGFLADPRWVWRAADALGVEPVAPPQYIRATSKLWPGARLARGEDWPDEWGR